MIDKNVQGGGRDKLFTRVEGEYEEANWLRKTELRRVPRRHKQGKGGGRWSRKYDTCTYTSNQQQDLDFKVL